MLQKNTALLKIFRLLVLPSFVVLVNFASFCPSAIANITLPQIFSDGMVVQRDKPIRVWGNAEPGEIVGIKFDSQASVAIADQRGSWLATLKPSHAGGPMEMVIHGKNEIVLKNILIGEVWLCSGQSNMEWEYQKTDFHDSDTYEAKHSRIRFFKLDRGANPSGQTNSEPNWIACENGNFGKCSAVAMFFALQLSRRLHVPIGIIEAAQGGAKIETFISRKSIDNSFEFKSMGTKSDREFATYAQAYAQYKTDLERYAVYMSAIQKPKEPKKARELEKAEAARELEKAEAARELEKPGKPREPEEPAKPQIQRVSGVFERLIAPVVPFSMRGVIFYQGESDINVSSLKYQKLFTLMIRDWRIQFGEPTLPVFYVQLPNLGIRKKTAQDSNLAFMREAQLLCRTVPYAYMVVTIDTVPGALAGLHPSQKREVGHRLAAAALATQYRIPVPFASPIYDSMEIIDGKVRVRFRYAEKGLISKSSPVVGFEIAGADKEWIAATAEIDGETVMVSSAKVSIPVAVRYGWADNPSVNLYSADKLPVSPFRTDDWPRIEAKRSF